MIAGDIMPEDCDEILRQAASTDKIVIPFGDQATLLVGFHEGRIALQLSPSPGSEKQPVAALLGPEAATLVSRLLESYASRMRMVSEVSTMTMN